jgi:peptidoglycan/LPS O-acetylase OafA/YrhL
MTVSDRARRTRNDAIDGLRALCIGTVIAYHLELPIFGGGFLGVEVFFVVSGYLITSLLLAEHEKNGEIDLKQFWFRRFRRLLPAVLTLLVFVSVLVPVFAPDAAVSFRRDAVGALLYISNWWQLWFGQSYFEAALRPPLLRHLWSLAVEEQFYLIWPVAMLGIARLKRTTGVIALSCFAFASALIMSVLHQNAEDGTRAYVGTDTRAFGLLIGAILALLVSAFPKMLKGRSVATGLGLLGVCGIIWATWALSPETSWLFPFGFLFVDVATVAALVGTLSLNERWLQRSLGNPVLRWLGTRSYGLYLFHFPIFQIMRPRIDVANHWWVNPARVLLSVAMAELSYRIVETPFRIHGFQGIKNRLGRRTVPVMFICAALVAFGTVGLWRTGPTALKASATESVIPPDAAPSAVPTTNNPGSGVSPDANSMIPSLPASDQSGSQVSELETIPVGTKSPPPTYPALSTIPVVSSPDGSTTTTLPLEAARVIALGDSVMLGAGRQLNRAFGQQLELDAVESRSWFKAPEELMRFDVKNNPPKVLILHLGNNGAPEESTLKQVIKLSENIPVVVIITVALPRRWESETNKRINAITKLRPDVRIADWYTYSTGQRGWFERDGFHLNEPGRFAYAEMLRVVLADTLPSVASTSAASASPTTSTTTTTSTSTTSTIVAASTSLHTPTSGFTSRPPVTTQQKVNPASTAGVTAPSTAPPTTPLPAASSVPEVSVEPPLAPVTVPADPAAPSSPPPTIPAAG